MNSDFNANFVNKNILIHISNALQTKPPDNYFKPAFISNFLEYLNFHEEVHIILVHTKHTLKMSDRMALMGPNKGDGMEYILDLLSSPKVEMGAVSAPAILKKGIRTKTSI